MPSAFPAAVRSPRSSLCVGADSPALSLDHHFRQPEIQNLGVAPPGHEEVSRLDVAMNDSRRVRGIQRVGDFNRYPQQFAELQRQPRNAVPQRHAVEQLHDDEGPSVALANLVDGADIRMVQRRSRPRFPAKALQGNRALGQVIG